MSRRRVILDNLFWFSASLVLAVVVWITANLNVDPVVQSNFRQPIPINILWDESTMIVTNTPTSNATVMVRAQQSVFEQLAADDIQVVADLSDVSTPGRITVPLTATISRNRQVTVASIRPSQIVVELEQRQERLVPLTVEVAGTPPASVEAQAPTLSVTQVLISGPSAAVSQVAAAQVTINLDEQRDSLNLELRPELVDEEGDAISGVTISPETVSISVQIEPRSDVSEVRVSPNLVGNLPDGYTLNGEFNYSPQSVFVSGTQEALNKLPGTILTTPIDLSDYTDDFDIRVPVDLPSDDLVLITGQRINVFVGIDPIQSSRQFEQVTLEIVSVPNGFNALVTPQTVTVLINGPQPILADLVKDEISVVVDASSLAEAGTFQIEPSVSVQASGVDENNISVIPAVVDLQLMLPPTRIAPPS